MKKMHGNSGNKSAKKDIVYSVLMQVRCTAEQKSIAVKNAAKNNMSFSDYIRHLIEKDDK